MTTSTLRLPRWRVSPVWLGLIAALVLLILILPTQGWASLTFTVNSFWDIIPFLLLSVVLAGWVKASSLDKQLGRVFAGRTVLVVVSAAAFGALSPFCSCGVIPIIAALLAAGVPLAGIMAFWLASPLMSPEIFLLTAAELGMGFAVARVATAFGIGLLSGAVVAWLQASGHLLKPQKDVKPSCGCSNPLKNAAVTWWFWGDPERRRVFWANVRDTGLLLSKWLLVAFFLESLLLRYVPAELVVSWLGDGIWALPLATLVPIFAWVAWVGAESAVRAYVVVVLGGLGSVPGALFGGLIVGVVESLGSGCFPDPSRGAAYKEAFALAIFALVLLLRPNGLFGRKE